MHSKEKEAWLVPLLLRSNTNVETSRAVGSKCRDSSIRNCEEDEGRMNGGRQCAHVRQQDVTLGCCVFRRRSTRNNYRHHKVEFILCVSMHDILCWLLPSFIIYAGVLFYVSFMTRFFFTGSMLNLHFLLRFNSRGT